MAAAHATAKEDECAGRRFRDSASCRRANLAADTSRRRWCRSGAQRDTATVLDDDDAVRLNLLYAGAVADRVAFDVSATVDEGPAQRSLVGIDDDLDLELAGVGACSGRRRCRWRKQRDDRPRGRGD